VSERRYTRADLLAALDLLDRELGAAGQVRPTDPVTMVATSTVNVRSSPRLADNVISTLSTGDRVTKSGETQGDAHRDVTLWYEIGAGRFVHSLYLMPDRAYWPNLPPIRAKQHGALGLQPVSQFDAPPWDRALALVSAGRFACAQVMTKGAEPRHIDELVRLGVRTISLRVAGYIPQGVGGGAGYVTQNAPDIERIWSAVRGWQATGLDIDLVITPGNELNAMDEYWAWNYPREQGMFILSAFEEIRRRWPGARVGLPAPCPMEIVGRVNSPAASWLAYTSAIDQANVIGYHVYWDGVQRTVRAALDEVVGFARRYPGKPVWVTEIARTDGNPVGMAADYIWLRQNAPALLPENVGPLFLFVGVVDGDEPFAPQGIEGKNIAERLGGA
jgi:hypothetical protein